MNILIKKDGGITLEDFARLGGEELACPLFGAKAVHLRMAFHVAHKAFAYVLPLFDDFDVRGSVLANLVKEDRVVGTA